MLCAFKVIKETEEFEKSLKEMEYLQGDSTDLLKYARDVNCHFASKKCKDVIVAARKLMTSKMHNTVKVCVSERLVLEEFTHIPPKPPDAFCSSSFISSIFLFSIFLC